MSKHRAKQKSGKEETPALALQAEPNYTLWRRVLLAVAGLATILVYSSAVRPQFFYDDADYIIADPRLDHPELFAPGGWNKPPPPLANEDIYLPAYQRPLIVDRYLWRLSFGLERWIGGPPINAIRSYVINILIHLACIAALYFTVRALLKLYRDDEKGEDAREDLWSLLPGFAALAFAVHPWTSESVSYISARNGSMGTFFVLLGTLCSVEAARRDTTWAMRSLGIFLALICAVLAYGCKENMVTAVAGYLLVTLPALAKRLWSRSPAAVIALAAGSTALLVFAAWLGINSSDRAAGLWAQSVGGRGWEYFFSIQNPLLLLTLGDQIVTQRVSLETNHPLWPLWACWLGLLLNGALVLLGTVGGLLRAPLLGLAWFYLHLIPTNSFLPRPEFLAGRNVYLPLVGIAVLVAALGLAAWHTLETKPGARKIVVAGFVFLFIFWAVTANAIARDYADVSGIWARSAKIAPDHATVRLNHAAGMSQQSRNDPKALEKIEAEFKAGLKAEESETMKYHSERPRMVRRSAGLRALGMLAMARKNHDDALALFKESFGVMPNADTWAAWIDCAMDARRDSAQEEALAAGLSRWPDRWFPKAARGVRSASSNPRLPWPEGVMADLREASNAPDSPQPSLRGLQVRAISLLAQAEREKTAEHIQRLRRLGTPESEIQRMEERMRGRQQQQSGAFR